LVVFAALATTLLSAATVCAKDNDEAPPEEPDPFNVGYTTFLAEMSGGRVTQIRVFYPTLEEADEQTQYTVQADVGVYQLDSPLWAVEDAQSLRGQFPLVVHDHGGGRAGRDLESVIQLPVHELMASHAIVTVVALRGVSPAAVLRHHLSDHHRYARRRRVVLQGEDP
jgi:hypothetical protein